MSEAAPAPFSKIEILKQNDPVLAGGLASALADPHSDRFAEDDEQFLRFHGIYQQDDRDLRKTGKKYIMMIRSRIPGGVMTAPQWITYDELASTYGNNTLRITTRQSIQFHGVVLAGLRPLVKKINESLLSTLAACGDVNRNVAVAANPRVSRAHAFVHAQAAALSEHLLPNTRAYYEIWIDEEKVAGSGEEAEPIYGATYLPRKFKIGFAIPPQNDVDVFAQDLGFIAVISDGELRGYNVAIGGGMGASHGDPETYPRLGDVIGFIAPGQVTAIAEAVITTQRDWGNREVRKRARLKYTIDDRGLENFKAEVERCAGFALLPARTFEFVHNGDRFGWVQGDDGRWHLTMRIVAGRIWDRDGLRHLSGLREIARALMDAAEGSTSMLEFRMTANQNLVIANVSDEQRARIDALVAQFGLDGYRHATPTRLNAIACVALPTCGLAMAEAERYLPDFLARIETLLDKHGLRDQPINIRISGCPNGCSRPYLGEIALVGNAPGRYNLMLGADHRGQRLNALYRENIDEAAILAALDTLFARYAEERTRDEYFGDFLLRSGLLCSGMIQSNRSESRALHIEVLP